MEGALAWIGQIAEWFGQFVPRIRNVRSTHQVIKFKRGKVYLCSAGLRVYWPLTTDFIEYPIVRQAVTLREQTLVTTDDKTVVVGGMMIYSVADLAVLVGETYWPDQSVKDISLTAVHDVCCKMSWEDLKREQRRGLLDTKLKNEAQAALKTYGVTVLKLMLTDLAPCRVLRVVQTSPLPGEHKE